jgi:hypothetical protein
VHSKKVHSKKVHIKKVHSKKVHSKGLKGAGVLLKRFSHGKSRTTIHIKGIKFKIHIYGSKLQLGKVAMKLLSSKNKKYPASKGWFTFAYHGWTFYIMITTKHIRMVGVKGKKVYKKMLMSSVPITKYLHHIVSKGKKPGKKPVKKPSKKPGKKNPGKKRPLIRPSISHGPLLVSQSVDFKDHRYQARVYGSTWQDAQRHCRSYGGNLATVTSKHLDNLLLKMLTKLRLKAAWIGYNDIKREGHWEWVNPTQRNSKYNNWRHGEPNNIGNEDCAAVVKGWGGKWNDAKCSNKYGFICETGGSSSTTHHVITSKFLILLKRFSNWVFSFPGLKFHFYISGGKLMLKNGKAKLAMKLLPSTNKKYPASKGWFTFAYHGWTYYVMITIKGVRMVGVHGKKVYGARIARPHYSVGKPLVHLNLAPKGFVLRRLNGRTFNILNFHFKIYRGHIFFGKRPMKLVKSTNKKFPGSRGYYTFTYGGWMYYVMFTPRGIRVTAMHGKKVVRSNVDIKKKRPNIKITKASFLLKRFMHNKGRATIHIIGIKFKFVIYGNKLHVGNVAMKLLPSTNKKYPASKGWFTFAYHG